MSFISKGFFQERIVKNGKLVEDVNANSFATNASGKLNYIVEGKKNNKKFTFTNMRKTRGAKERGAKERGSKKKANRKSKKGKK